MSYTRVLVSESGVPYSQFLKMFRKSVEPGLNGFKKQKVVSSWSLVQTGDHTGLLIAEFDTKAKMNQYLKTMAAVREDVTADTGQQVWIYHGPVKASG